MQLFKLLAIPNNKAESLGVDVFLFEPPIDRAANFRAKLPKPQRFSDHDNPLPVVAQPPLEHVMSSDLPVLYLLCCFVDEHDLDDEVAVAEFGGVGEFLLFVELDYLDDGFAFGFGYHQVYEKMGGELCGAAFFVIET